MSCSSTQGSGTGEVPDTCRNVLTIGVLKEYTVGSRYMWIFYIFFCLVFAMSLCASVATCWERADLLALVCGV